MCKHTQAHCTSVHTLPGTAISIDTQNVSALLICCNSKFPSVVISSDTCGFYESKQFLECSLFSYRVVVLKHVLYLSACQQWLGQACDPWPHTVKLTLPPVGCCAKCQKRPLILSCCLLGHSAPDYLSCPDQCTYIPSSPARTEDHLLNSASMLHRPTEILIFLWLEQNDAAVEL